MMMGVKRNAWHDRGGVGPSQGGGGVHHIGYNHIVLVGECITSVIISPCRVGLSGMDLAGAVVWRCVPDWIVGLVFVRYCVESQGSPSPAFGIIDISFPIQVGKFVLRPIRSTC